MFLWQIRLPASAARLTRALRTFRGQNPTRSRFDIGWDEYIARKASMESAALQPTGHSIGKGGQDIDMAGFARTRMSEPTNEDATYVISKGLQMLHNDRQLLHRAKAMLQIDMSVFEETRGQFVFDVQQNSFPAVSTDRIKDIIRASGPEEASRSVIAGFYRYLMEKAPREHLGHLPKTFELLDASHPFKLFPKARNINRKIIMHVGPTNSGKTHSALKRLEQCNSGLYCSPLRLLALEIYRRMTQKGIPSNLITGEDRRISEERVKVVSCTVEMAYIGRTYEVVVIDEIQMIYDNARGWAWTVCLMAWIGTPAREVHLCGEERAVPYVRKLCAYFGESVEVREYSRLKELRLAEKPLGSLKNLRKGDCVVTFSKTNIQLLRSTIEARLGLRCAMIYGSLPPEVRAQQAELFNDPESGYGILIATDAIGMGLNLNIGRIIFHTLRKFDGSTYQQLTIPHIKQIAGRAGRYGSDFNDGEVTTLRSIDFPLLREAIAHSVDYESQTVPLPIRGGVTEALHAIFSRPAVKDLLYLMEDVAQLDHRVFRLFSPEEFKTIATAIERFRIPIESRVQIMKAPVQMRDPLVARFYVNLARAISRSNSVRLEDLIPVMTESQLQFQPLEYLDSTYRALTVYLWVSHYIRLKITDTEQVAVYMAKVKRVIASKLNTKQLGATTPAAHSPLAHTPILPHV